MTSSESFDIIIIGGGPAGSAVAITMAHGGFHPVIIERSAYSKPRIGETLPAAMTSLLIRLGVWQRFLADGHIQSFALRSVWGGAEQRENESIFNPVRFRLALRSGSFRPHARLGWRKRRVQSAHRGPYYTSIQRPDLGLAGRCHTKQ